MHDSLIKSNCKFMLQQKKKKKRIVALKIFTISRHSILKGEKK